MSQDVHQEAFLRTFYQNTDHRVSLGAGDPRYVPLYQADDADPMRALAGVIARCAGESAQLLFGARGVGKSTEQRRLAQTLRDSGEHAVFVCDLEPHMNMNTAVEISDLLISMAGAFGEQVQAELGEKLLETSYYAHAEEFFRRTQLDLPGLRAHPTIGLKAHLKHDPTVRVQVQRHLSGHLSALTREVHGYLYDVVTRVRAATGKPDVVLILDSIEHISGVGADAQRVFDSVVEMFVGQADKLRVPHLHVVFTAPFWLELMASGLKSLYSGTVHVPSVRVRNKDGAPNAQGLAMMCEVVKRRGDWEVLLGDDCALLDTFSLASGGNLRDLLRLVQRGLLAGRHRTLPLNDAQRHRVLLDVQSSTGWLSGRDRELLAEVHAHKWARLEGARHGPGLAGLFERSLILCYREGGAWHDAHPLVWDVLPGSEAKAPRRD